MLDQGASNQVLPRATAIVSAASCRTRIRRKSSSSCKDFLTDDPPWGVKVTVKPSRAAGEVVDDRSDRARRSRRPWRR